MRTMLIFNPAAGQAESLERELASATEVWTKRGWSVDRRPTDGPGAGERLAREAAAAGYDLVVAAGGDGTINEVINGLVGSRTAMANLPLGTMNVWARELGLPLQPRAAAEALLHWKAQPIDLGRAGERHFLLMAGIGFDAAITAGVQPAVKRRFGALAYVLRGFEVAFSIRGTRTRLNIDGKLIGSRVLMIVVGNSQLYGGLVKITDRAVINDGLLDVCVIRGNNFWGALRQAGAIILGRARQDPEISYYRAKTIAIHARPPLPVQVDGDAIGKTPLQISVVPGGLLALLPPQPPEGLLQPPTKA